MKIDNIYDLQDIVISALRYALGRKTYLTLTTASFIKQYPELISNRVKQVMLKDLNEYFEHREKSGTYLITDDECDCRTWADLYDWLESIEVKE